MGFGEVFAEAEAQYKAKVMANTWGHLAPAAQTKYTGWILFTLGCHGDNTVIDYEFNDAHHNELPGSPWFTDHMMDLIGDYCLKMDYGTVCLFEGS
jgi:hypothetical protein